MLMYNNNVAISTKKSKLRLSLRQAKVCLCFFGIAATLSSLAIPLSSSSARSAFSRDQVSIDIGIGNFIGVEATNQSPGTDVAYSDGVYSKKMELGEKVANFGETTFKIICNFDSNDDDAYYGGYNCQDNGWALVATPTKTTTVDGQTYAAMVAQDGDATATILSQSNSFESNDSNWAIQVTPVQRTVLGVDATPTVVASFASPHLIPAVSTEIAYSKSWRTKDRANDLYIDSFGVNVQHGISVGASQMAGTYKGEINYTVALKAST